MDPAGSREPAADRVVGFIRAQGRFAVAALPGILALALLSTPARAFAPEAAAGIARQAAGALPPAARWSEAWNDAASIAVTRRLEAEARDPEAVVESHRFDTDLWTSGDPAGGAAAALSGARDALRAAFATGDAPRAIAALADLAVSTADLADPFQVTSPARAEVPGAHVLFSDLIGPADLAGLVPFTAPAGGALAAGTSLALESAASRSAIEDAARNRDDATVAVTRRDRLEAALSVAGGMVLGAWRDAGSPSLDRMGWTPGAVRAWPNPARGAASLELASPAAGHAVVELVDVAGRRCWSRELDLGAGTLRIALPGETIEALAPGVYLARVSAPGLSASARLVRAPR